MLLKALQATKSESWFISEQPCPVTGSCRWRSVNSQDPSSILFKSAEMNIQMALNLSLTTIGCCLQMSWWFWVQTKWGVVLYDSLACRTHFVMINSRQSLVSLHFCQKSMFTGQSWEAPAAPGHLSSHVAFQTFYFFLPVSVDQLMN